MTNRTKAALKAWKTRRNPAIKAWKTRRARKALAAAVVIALVAVTPAKAHAHGGWNWGSFAVGAIAGGIFAPNFYQPYYSPPVVFAPPPVWYYPPGAPTVIVPSVQPDPVIRHVQYGLNMLGYGPLNVDGIEGPSTYQAISGFQANNGLMVDGIAGGGTLAVLDAQLARRAPPPPPPVDHDKSPA